MALLQLRELDRRPQPPAPGRRRLRRRLAIEGFRRMWVVPSLPWGACRDGPACLSSRTTRTLPAFCAGRWTRRATTCAWPATARPRSTQASDFEPDAVVLDLGLPPPRRRRGLPAPARGGRRADPDPHRPRRARLARRGPRLRRRRLPRQALRARRAAGSHARADAPAPAARQRVPGGRRPAPQPRHAARCSAASATSS